jgi:hypothetical protein
VERRLLTVRTLTNPGVSTMRNAVAGAHTLREQLEQSLKELGAERERIRIQLGDSTEQIPLWAELERRACIAELVGRKATPAARRTVDGTLAAVRAFREGLMLH